MIKRYRCKRKVGRVLPRHGRIKYGSEVELTDEELASLGKDAVDFEPIGPPAGDPDPLPEPGPEQPPTDSGGDLFDEEEVTDG